LDGTRGYQNGQGLWFSVEKVSSQRYCNEGKKSSHPLSHPNYERVGVQEMLKSVIKLIH